jgi:hypothetical protein
MRKKELMIKKQANNGMRIIMFILLALALLFFLSPNVDASAKTGTLIHFTIVDTTPPASVTNLENISLTNSSIEWNWTNPLDIDFAGVIIYINGIWEANLSLGYNSYNLTGLNAETNYTITIHTIDFNGNINNTDINNTAITLANQPPLITLNNPPNNAVDVDGNVIFNCSAEDEIGLDRIELYINNTLNQTNSTVSGTSGNSIFIVNDILDGIYNWGCKAYNVVGKDNESFRNLIVDRNATPIYTNFTGNTTYWEEQEDITNICDGQAIVDNPPTGMVVWNHCVNASYANFDVNVELSYNYVEVEFGLDNSFNSSASITMRNLPWDFMPVILSNGEECPESKCMNIEYNISTGTLTFDVDSFSNFTTIANSQLAIWNQNDIGYPNADRTISLDEQIDFYANYSRNGNNNPITGANCIISFNDGINGTMSYNSTSTYYEYNRSFNTSGIKNYEITCSRNNFETITLTDNIIFTSDQIVYSMASASKLELSISPDVIMPNQPVLIEADVIINNNMVSDINLSYINVSIVRMEGNNNITVVDNIPMDYIEKNIWTYEWILNSSHFGNYYAVVSLETNEIEPISLIDAKTFTVGNIGVISIRGISPDVINGKMVVRLASEVTVDGVSIDSSNIYNPLLLITNVENGTITEINSSDGLNIIDGLIYYDYIFNTTGSYMLSWNLYYNGLKKSANEIIVAVDWDEKLDYINQSINESNNEVISLILSNREGLIKLLSDTNYLKEFSSEQVYLITDSINSMTRISNELNNNTITPEEAIEQMNLINQELKSSGNNKLTGYATKSTFKETSYHFKSWIKEFFSPTLMYFILFLIIAFLCLLLFSNVVSNMSHRNNNQQNVVVLKERKPYKVKSQSYNYVPVYLLLSNKIKKSLNDFNQRRKYNTFTSKKNRKLTEFINLNKTSNHLRSVQLSLNNWQISKKNKKKNSQIFYGDEKRVYQILIESTILIIISLLNYLKSLIKSYNIIRENNKRSNLRKKKYDSYIAYDKKLPLYLALYYSMNNYLDELLKEKNQLKNKKRYKQNEDVNNIPSYNKISAFELFSKIDREILKKSDYIMEKSSDKDLRFRRLEIPIKKNNNINNNNKINNSSINNSTSTTTTTINHHNNHYNNNHNNNNHNNIKDISINKLSDKNLDKVLSLKKSIHEEILPASYFEKLNNKRNGLFKRKFSSIKSSVSNPIFVLVKDKDNKKSNTLNRKDKLNNINETFKVNNDISFTTNNITNIILKESKPLGVRSHHKKQKIIYLPRYKVWFGKLFGKISKDNIMLTKNQDSKIQEESKIKNIKSHLRDNNIKNNSISKSKPINKTKINNINNISSNNSNNKNNNNNNNNVEMKPLYKVIGKEIEQQIHKKEIKRKSENQKKLNELKKAFNF